MSSTALGIFALISSSFAVAILLTRLMISLAPRIGFVDKPGGRKIHDNPKPLGGGVAITLGIVLPLLAGIITVHFAPDWTIANLADRSDARALVNGARQH
jgi:UDP-N-acetylmuramyl pentapeptide phosphotransferase/UDP-N-acetylglucosamine-1-phosphate transferase